MCASTVFATEHLIHVIFVQICSRQLSVVHILKNSHFLTMYISHYWLYQHLINIRWHHLTSFSTWHTFSFLFFLYPLRLIFNKNSVLSFSLCPPLGGHLAKHRNAYYKETLLARVAGGPLLLEPRWSQKTFKRDTPLLPAFVVFVFLALLCRDWGLCSHWRGWGRKAKGMDLQSAVDKRF